MGMNIRTENEEDHDLEYDIAWAVHDKVEEERGKGNKEIYPFLLFHPVALEMLREYLRRKWFEGLAVGLLRLGGPWEYELDRSEFGIIGILTQTSVFLEQTNQHVRLRKLWQTRLAEEMGGYWSSVRKKNRGYQPHELLTPAQFLMVKEYMLRVLSLYASILSRIGPEKERESVLSRIEQVEKEEQLKLTKKPTDKRKIDEKLFWEIIEVSFASEEGDPLDVLVNHLEAFSKSSILSFERILRKKLGELYDNNLWAVAFISKHGCSDDGFTYFRAWVISRGRQFFEAVVKDPSFAVKDMEKGEKMECEELLYAANTAYENTAGEPLWSKVSQSEVKLKGKDWKEEDLPKLYPELCQRFDFDL